MKTNFAMFVGKGQHLIIIGRMQTGTSTMEISMEVP